jgi:ribosomal protein S18 acetylase RimI-like enzyme
LKDNKTNNYIGYAHIDYDKLYWFGIYIEPEYQSIKLGELLLKYILSHEKVNKIPTITLAVNKNNYAIRLYENNNFKIVNENDKYYFMELNK